MTSPILSYPFDPTGTLASNLIPPEQIVVNAVNYRDYHFVVPRWAPFFVDGANLQFTDTNGATRTLVMGVDWIPCFEFISASRACAKPIWGGIQFLDTQLAGVLTVTYQTLGGIWTIDLAKISELLAYALHNPRVTAWEEVVDQPMKFPPIDHEWDLVDMVGMSDVVNKLTEIENVIRTAQGGDWSAHVNNFNNPHQTTAAQVGLGNVQNYPIASAADAAAGTSNIAYMTPAMTYLMQYSPNGVGTNLNTHLADHNNPHATTAAQVGAYSTAQTDALLSGKLGTTAQAADTILFNGRDQNAYAAWVLAQTAANSLKFDGLTSSAYKTFVLQGQAADSALFAGQTPAQYAASVLTGKAADSALFNGMTPSQFTTQVLGGQAADSLKLAGYTYSQVMSNILAGKANDTFNFNGMDANTYAAWVLANGVAANAQKLNGQTPAQLTTSILSGTAANATLFNGLDQATFTNQVLSQIGGVTGVTRQKVLAPTSGEAAGSYWQELTRVRMPNATFPAVGMTDIQWILSANDAAGSPNATMYYIHATNNVGAGTAAKLEVINMANQSIGFTFGYVISNVDWSDGAGAVATLRIFVKTGANVGPITITQLSQDSGTLQPPSRTTVEPTGITYAVEDAFAKISDLNLMANTLTTAFASVTTSLS